MINTLLLLFFGAGIGNSGGDIAVELSRHSSQVFLSTRRGAWVLSRLGKGGEPADQQVGRRFIWYLPGKLLGYLFHKVVNERFDHEAFALRPQHLITAQHPMVNDDLPHRIITGSVVVKPNVSHFTKTGVVFDDGSEVNDLDVVIFCTGYKIGFKFIDHSILPVNDNMVELYKYVFPPNLAKPTLAVLGCVQPLGAIFPISELQARWATQVFIGKKSLPTKVAMMENIKKKKKDMAKRYYATKRHTIQVRCHNNYRTSTFVRRKVPAVTCSNILQYLSTLKNIFHMENTHGHFKTGSDMLPVFFQGILRLSRPPCLIRWKLKRCHLA